MTAKKTLESYLTKCDQQIKITESSLSKLRVTLVELNAQRDVLLGLYNTCYPQKPTSEEPSSAPVDKKVTSGKSLVEKKKK